MTDTGIRRRRRLRAALAGLAATAVAVGTVAVASNAFADENTPPTPRPSTFEVDNQALVSLSYGLTYPWRSQDPTPLTGFEIWRDGEWLADVPLGENYTDPGTPNFIALYEARSFSDKGGTVTDPADFLYSPMGSTVFVPTPRDIRVAERTPTSLTIAWESVAGNPDPNLRAQELVTDHYEIKRIDRELDADGQPEPYSGAERRTFTTHDTVWSDPEAVSGHQYEYEVVACTLRSYCSSTHTPTIWALYLE